MTDAPTSPSLPGDLLRRSQEALVAKAEADAAAAVAGARKATTDADTSALQSARSGLSALVPDLTGVNLGRVDDATTSVEFSGVVTYAALADAAATVAERVGAAVGAAAPARARRILVTSQSDLLSSQLTHHLLLDAVRDAVHVADHALAATGPQTADDAAPDDTAPDDTAEPAAGAADLQRTPLLGPVVTAGIAGLLTAVAGPAAPVALAAGGAVASAVPGLISLLSTTTTIKEHAEDIGDLAAAAAVIAGLTARTGVVVSHDDFRLVPRPPEGAAGGEVSARLQDLARRRADLLVRTMDLQRDENAADLRVAHLTAQRNTDQAAAAAAGTDPPPPPAALTTASAESADRAAALALVAAAVSTLDTVTTAAQACAPGARSPVAVALLAEALERHWYDHVLTVKSLGGQSREAVRDRRLRADTYTILADASVQYMLLDLAEHGVVASGVATGVATAHGRVGEVPTITTAPPDPRRRSRRRTTTT